MKKIKKLLFENIIHNGIKKNKLWEAEADGSQGQEIKTIPANMMKPCLY